MKGNFDIKNNEMLVAFGLFQKEHPYMEIVKLEKLKELFNDKPVIDITTNAGLQFRVYIDSLTVCKIKASKSVLV